MTWLGSLILFCLFIIASFEQLGSSTVGHFKTLLISVFCRGSVNVSYMITEFAGLTLVQNTCALYQVWPHGRQCAHCFDDPQAGANSDGHGIADAMDGKHTTSCETPGDLY